MNVTPLVRRHCWSRIFEQLFLFQFCCTVLPDTRWVEFGLQQPCAILLLLSERGEHERQYVSSHVPYLSWHPFSVFVYTCVILSKPQGTPTFCLQNWSWFYHSYCFEFITINDKIKVSDVSASKSTANSDVSNLLSTGRIRFVKNCLATSDSCSIQMSGSRRPVQYYIHKRSSAKIFVREQTVDFCERKKPNLRPDL